MSPSTPLIFLAALAAASAGSSQSFTPYHELRHEFGSIDTAVAAMPSSDIHGSFNRISAVLERGSVRDLGSNAGTLGLLPGNYANGMGAAIEDLGLDFFGGVESIDLDQKYALLQVIDLVAVKRNTQFYPPPVPPPCDNPPCFFIPLLPPLITQLNGFLALTRPFLADMAAFYGANRLPTDPPVPTIPATITAHNFRATMDDIRLTYGYVRGVESIDD